MAKIIDKIQIGDTTYDVGYPLIEGGGTTDSTAKTSEWTGTHSGITSYYDGLTIRYKIGVAGQTTTTLNINGLGAKRIYRFSTTALTTHFPVGSIINLVYHTDLNDGCWMCNDYDANTNTQARTYKTTSTATYYPILTRYSTANPTTYSAEYTRYSSKITANHGLGYLKAVKFVGDLEGNVIGNLDGSMTLQRMTKSYKEHAYDQTMETFEVWFNGSDDLAAVEMPEKYCITEFKKGSNHRFIAEATCLTSGKRYQSSNMGATADTTARGTWLAWQELPSAEDKTKLNGIAAGAEVNQNAFAKVTVGATTITADAKQDTLTLVAGSNVTITPDATNDKITIAATNTVYTHPTTTAATGVPTANSTPGFGGTFQVNQVSRDALGHVSAITPRTITIPNSTATTATYGLMSAADKKKLEGIADGANKYSLPTAKTNALGGVMVGTNLTVTTDGVLSANAQTWGQITNKPTSFSPTAHTHSISDVADNTSYVRMTPAERTKLAGIATGANNYSLPTATTNTLGGVKVDATMSTTSTNPVQNKVVDAAIKAVKNDLLSGAGEAYDTLKELGELIDDNTDAIDALERVAASKASAVHTHAISDVTDLQETLNGKAPAEHTHNYAASSSPGSGANYAKKLETYYQGDANKTYGSQYPVYAQWYTNDRLKFIVDGYPTEVDHAAKLVTTATVGKAAAPLTVGSATKPVYFSGGVPVECNYTVATNVPSNAKFTDTTYATATTTANGLMASADKVKLNGIAAGANNYTLPTASTSTLGGIKVGTNLTVSTAGVLSANAQTWGQITNKPTTFTPTAHTHTLADVSDTSTRLAMTSAERTKLAGIATGANKYTHPTYTEKSSGLYKITVDGTGHISGATAVTKSDITALGIPSTNTTYGTATTSANGLMSAADKTKLDGIATGAEVNQNAFAAVTVEGHSSVASAASKSDTLKLISGPGVTLTPSGSGKSVKAEVSWNGNVSGGISPIGASLSAEHSANRLAFINPAALLFEQTSNGSTWTTKSLTNGQKRAHCTTSYTVQVGPDNDTVTTTCGMRLTITGQDGTNQYVYTRPKKLLVDMTTNGHSVKLVIEAKKGTSGAAWEKVAEGPISGWSGWNEFDISKFATLGGGNTQTSNYWYWRFTYTVTAVSSSSSYAKKPPTINALRLFGDTAWYAPSEMAKTGHLYDYDENENATFPGTVDAANLKINGTAVSSLIDTKIASAITTTLNTEV